MNSLRSLAVKLPGKQALIHLIKPVPLEVLALPAEHLHAELSKAIYHFWTRPISR